MRSEKLCKTCEPVSPIICALLAFGVLVFLIFGSVYYSACSTTNLGYTQYSNYHTSNCRLINFNDSYYITVDGIHNTPSTLVNLLVFNSGFTCVIQNDNSYPMMLLDDTGCVNTNVFDCKKNNKVQVDCINKNTLNGFILLIVFGITFILLILYTYCCCKYI